MLNSYTRILVGDKDYPIAFTLNVMEQIQKKYGEFQKWVDLFSNIEGEVPVGDLIWTFNELFNEGIDIDNENNNTKIPMLEHRKVGRMITEFGQTKAVNVLFKLVKDSVPEADESKNSKADPTQK